MVKFPNLQSIYISMSVKINLRKLEYGLLLREHSLVTMPRAVIAPSVLASDFGQLTAECERMIKNGAEWLHMGRFSSLTSLIH